MRLEDAVRELKLHGLVTVIGVGKKKTYILSDEAVRLINASWLLRRAESPKEKAEDIAMEALIITIIVKLGMVEDRCLPKYIDALKYLAENTYDIKL